MLAAIRVWLISALIFAGIAVVTLLVGVLVHELRGRHIVAPLWLVPVVALFLGGLFALPGAIRVYGDGRKRAR